MQINYYDKYIKYKNKYISLNNQNGGLPPLTQHTQSSKTINSIIVSHNGRIRCLLDKILLGQLDKISKKMKIRFMNCCILLLEITDCELKLNLIYTGELGEDSSDKTKKRKYYITPGDNKEYNILEGIPFDEIRASPDILKLPEIGDNTYKFYIIRHGDGIHNSMNSWDKAISSKITDAELSHEGISQAINAGQILFNTGLNITSIDYLFISDLKRTRQTIFNILKQGPCIKYKRELIVLQCAHELEYIPNSDGTCDGYQKKSVFSYENKSKCSIITNTSSCPIKDEDEDYDINWEYYSNFYGKSTRMNDITSMITKLGITESKQPIRQHCHDTNMIKEALIIINTIMNPN